MEEIKKYEFTLNNAEINEFCRVAMLEQLKCKKRMWIRVAVIIILEFLLLPKGAVLIAAFTVLIVMAVFLRTSAEIKKSISGQKWKISIEDGKIKADRGVGGEMPCSAIRLIRTTPHLLLFGYMQNAERPAWYIMPLRVFADEQEREQFIASLRHPYPPGTVDYMGNIINNHPDMDIDENKTETQEYLRFSYDMNEEKWVHLEKEAFGIVAGGILGNTGRIRTTVIFGCSMTVILIIATYLAAGHFYWRDIVLSVCIALLLTVRLFFKNPERVLKKQAENTDVRNRICGTWQVFLKEEGVSAELPGGTKNFFPWDFIGWLVEAESAFYLFHKDKKHDVIIVKESIQDQNQVLMLHQLCVQKGIKDVQAKKAFYMPDWLFFTLFAVIAAAYIGVLFLPIFYQ